MIIRSTSMKYCPMPLTWPRCQLESRTYPNLSCEAATTPVCHIIRRDWASVMSHFRAYRHKYAGCTGSVVCQGHPHLSPASILLNVFAKSGLAHTWCARLVCRGILVSGHGYRDKWCPWPPRTLRRATAATYVHDPSSWASVLFR